MSETEHEKPPEKIWLQLPVYDDEYFTTWCQEKINEEDVSYILETIHNTQLGALRAELAAARAERDALKARAERAEAALIAIREWLWSGKMANAQRIGAPIVAPNNVADIVNAVFDAMPDPGEGR